MLLQDASIRIAGSTIGGYAISAEAIDESAAAFYRQHRSLAFIDRPRSFYLPMRTVLANLRE